MTRGEGTELMKEMICKNKEVNEMFKESVKGYTLMVLKDYLETDKEIEEAMAELNGLLEEVSVEEARKYYNSQI